MWTGDNLWHRTVICHNSNCMELELAPKGKDMSSLLVFSTLEAINLSLNIQKDHFFFQKSIPWGLYCLRKVIYTSAVRLRASKLHCPLLLRSEVGKRGSQRYCEMSITCYTFVQCTAHRRSPPGHCCSVRVPREQGSVARDNGNNATHHTPPSTMAAGW